MENQFPWASRIFERFFVLYGRQKTSSMFGLVESEIEAAKEAWEHQLRQTDPEVIKRVLQSLAQTPRDWPPSLAEWIGLCKTESHHAQMRQAAALPAPSSAPTDYGRTMIRIIRESLGAEDPLFWAKHPKSPAAVDLLVRGAQRDHRLQALLQAHLDNGGVACRSDDARRAIVALRAQGRFEARSDRVAG